ncbi:MAG: hypothetical protein GY847_10980 [Proteobacteria bacterium]|nr:hypothetical protein [Pseudomonadota bacterium]
MKKHTAFFTVLCLGLVLNSPAALAQNKKDKARNLFNKGVAALEDHDYRVALDLFDDAYRTSPHWMVLAHIGTCYAKLNKPVSAIWALEKFLEDGGEDIDPEEREVARRLLGDQRKKVGVLNLIVEPHGSEAKIDGESIGKAPLERRIIKAGPHNIIIIDGNTITDKDVHIYAGQENVVRIPDEKSAPPVVAVTPAAAPIPEKPTMDEPVEATPLPEPDPEPEIEPYSEASYDDFDEDIPVDEEMPNGVSVPFFVAIGVAGAGIVTGGLGWGLFAYNNASEANYAVEIEGQLFESLTWADTCNSGNSTEGDEITVGTEKERYFCDTELQRREYARKARVSLIPAITGTCITALAGTAALLFYFHPEWFSSNESTASITLTPMVSSSHPGLILSGTF